MRAQNLPILPPVETFTVAPHRYLYDAPYDPEAKQPTTYREVKAAAPYKIGDVIYVAYGDGYARAYVHDISCRRDRWDDLQEVYLIRRETKTGEFGKRAYQTFPGLIQRGYHRAGLAPDIPAGVM